MTSIRIIFLLSLLLIGNYQNADSIMNDLKGTKSTVKPETKTVGIGSQILKELGLKKY